MRFLAIIFMILTSSFTQFIENKNDENFIRVEINYSPSYSLKIFEDGLLCEAYNSNLKKVYNFYPLKDLDYEKFLKLQAYLHLHETTFFEMDSVQENPLIRYSSYRLDFLLIEGSKIKQIEWLSGENTHLEELLNLINDLIPKKTRGLYKINPR